MGKTELNDVNILICPNCNIPIDLFNHDLALKKEIVALTAKVAELEKANKKIMGDWMEGQNALKKRNLTLQENVRSLNAGKEELETGQKGNLKTAYDNGVRYAQVVAQEEIEKLRGDLIATQQRHAELEKGWGQTALDSINSYEKMAYEKAKKRTISAIRDGVEKLKRKNPISTEDWAWNDAIDKTEDWAWNDAIDKVLALPGLKQKEVKRE